MSQIVIERYHPRWAADFAELNLAWIEELFVVEDEDRKVLLAPEKHIIAPGGDILFALDGEQVVGCVALKPTAPGVLELTKMAVLKARRAQGIGARLLTAAIARARELGATALVLDTHSSLVNAIALYTRFGFARVATVDSPYARADVSMRLPLD